MTFATEWDARYRAGTHLSTWPWSDLVRLVKRYVSEIEGVRVLELGAGFGANLPFFVESGADYFAIEGSDTALQVGDAYRAYRLPFDRLYCGDFTKSIPFVGPFDLIVDRSSVTHNDTGGIRWALSLAHDALRPGGLYIGVDWWSTEHSAYKYGAPIDGYTRTGYTCGPFEDVGPVHFTNQTHLRALFSAFEILHLEHKVRDTLVPIPERVAAWDIVARRNG